MLKFNMVWTFVSSRGVTLLGYLAWAGRAVKLPA